MSTESLLQEARILSVAERMQLVEELWDSIGEQPADLPLTAEQRDELDRRLADCEADPNAGSPWSEVRDRLERRNERRITFAFPSSRNAATYDSPGRYNIIQLLARPFG